jgi:hypothetical protein
MNTNKSSKSLNQYHLDSRLIFTPNKYKLSGFNKENTRRQSLNSSKIVFNSSTQRLQNSLTNSQGRELLASKNFGTKSTNIGLNQASDSIRISDLPQVRKKFNILIDDINQYKSRVQKARDKVNSMMYSRREFQATSFEKYIASKNKGLDQTNREYKISLTTKNCRLSNSEIQVERFSSPQKKMLKSNSIFLKTNNLNLNPKLKAANPPQSPDNPDGDNTPKNATKKSRIESTFKNVFLGVKCRTSFRNTAALKRVAVINMKEQIKQSEFDFKDKLNQKLLMNFFDYQLKVNNKAGVTRTLNAYPELVSLVDKFGKYPIHYSVNRSMSKMTKILISFGSPLDVSDKLGNSPLHYAYVNGNEKILKVK